MGKATTLRQTIAEIAADTEGIDEDRVKLGYVSFADSEEFLNNLATDGFFVVVHDSNNSSHNAGTFNIGEYEIRVTTITASIKTKTTTIRKLKTPTNRFGMHF